MTLLVLAFCMLKLAEDDVCELNMRGVKIHSYNSTQNITQLNTKRETPVYPAHPLPSLHGEGNWDLWDTGNVCDNHCLFKVSLKRVIPPLWEIQKTTWTSCQLTYGPRDKQTFTLTHRDLQTI